MRTTSSPRRVRLGVLIGLASAAAAAFVALGYAAPNQTSAQLQYAPVNTAPPTISDTTPQVGQTLTAANGTWTGDAPIVFTYQWLRCNAGGQSCVSIPGATSQSYTVQPADLNNTLRVRVTGTNASGSSAAESAATSRVAAATPPTGAVPIAAVVLPNRLNIDQVRFSPNPIRLSTRTIDVRVHVLEQSGRPVSGALVFVRSTPLVTSSAGEAATGNDGWATVRLAARSNYSIIRFQDNLQIFVRARKAGENLQAGVSSRRLVQVSIG
ncbi:MAG: hypothetical protein ICV67_02350 [Thermoleophilia bacterium]|nr:hypothetical protein [Thermoleophilia bacterium]